MQADIIPSEADTDRRWGDSLPLTDHLDELRRRIIQSAVVVFLALIIGFTLSLPILEMLKAMSPQGVVFVQLSPGEVLMASIRIAVGLGLALASPVLLYQILRFVMPGLDTKERRLVLLTVGLGAVLFVCGVLFGYLVVTPSALLFLFDYGQTVAVNQISVAKYTSFCVSILLLTGILFELPVVLFLLSYLNVVTSAKLLQQWRWALLLIVVAAAILTPSQDPVTLLFVAGAMGLLYFASIVPIKLSGR